MEKKCSQTSHECGWVGGGNIRGEYGRKGWGGGKRARRQVKQRRKKSKKGDKQAGNEAVENHRPKKTRVTKALLAIGKKKRKNSPYKTFAKKKRTGEEKPATS